MNLLATCILLLLQLVVAQDHLRKISGDAAPEKAQEPIRVIEDVLQTIDSSIQLGDRYPEPPELPIGMSESTSQRPATLPVFPPSLDVAPPSIRPQESVKIQEARTFSTHLPPSSTIMSTVPIETVTISYTYDDEKVNIDDILPETKDDLEEFQKADSLEKEKNEVLQTSIEDVKNLVKKISTINATNDYYITSPATTLTPSQQNDPVESINDIIDFNKLFVKKISNDRESDTKTTTVAPTFTTSSATPSGISTPNPFENSTFKELGKACIHLKDLHKVDEDSDDLKVGTKTGSISVSVELGESHDDDDDDESGDDASEEETTTTLTTTSPAPVRHVRENKKAVVWKKYEMNCEEEEDEKGNICKLWAAGGLCGTHRPTMFLFCRKTCLCVGPPKILS